MTEDTVAITSWFVEAEGLDLPQRKKCDALFRLYRRLFEDTPTYGDMGMLLKKSGGSILNAANVLFFVASLSPLDKSPASVALGVAYRRHEKVAGLQKQEDDANRAAVSQQLYAMEQAVLRNPSLQPKLDELRKRLNV